MLVKSADGIATREGIERRKKMESEQGLSICTSISEGRCTLLVAIAATLQPGMA
jgi:hypothetical protein